MAFWDAVVRVLVGSILIWLGIENKGAWVVGEVVGFVLIFTAILNFCPLYKIAGITSKAQEQEAA